MALTGGKFTPSDTPAYDLSRQHIEMLPTKLRGFKVSRLSAPSTVPGYVSLRRHHTEAGVRGGAIICEGVGYEEQRPNYL